MNQSTTLYLASASPRRGQLLQQIGVEFEAFPVDIDESRVADESAIEYVCRMARSKAETGYCQLAEDYPQAVVLGADTIIAVDGDIIGKPADRKHCQRILKKLSARQHSVMTAIAVVTHESVKVRLSQNRVEFRELTEAEISAYCNCEEPMDKAGAYAIQGMAAVFIERLEGSYSAVMGLPLFETAELLQSAGISILES